MAIKGTFPKEDGNILYGVDANIGYYQELNSATMNYGVVVVATSATVIKAANSLRKVILIKNNSTEDMYIGASGVTTSNGQLLKPDQSIRLYTQDSIYAISTAEATDARYLEVQ